MLIFKPLKKMSILYQKKVKKINSKISKIKNDQLNSKQQTFNIISKFCN